MKALGRLSILEGMALAGEGSLTEPTLHAWKCMVNEPGTRKDGAQQESPAEREAKKNPANQQNLEKPAEGRDEAPADRIKEGKRDPSSPWMGGG